MNEIAEIMQRGGVVMWPLLLLSLITVTLLFERAWFFLKTNSPTTNSPKTNSRQHP